MAYGGQRNLYNSMRGSPLYFFYDCEATNFEDIENERILEVAAVLYTGNLSTHISDHDMAELSAPHDHYHSLCHCEREIHPEVIQNTQLTLAKLRDQPRPAKVLEELFDWMASKVAQVQKLADATYTPVLVAHSGNILDYPLIVTELERSGNRSLNAKFDALNLHFADTYDMCRKMKNRYHPLLRNVTKLGLSGLHAAFFPQEPFDGHRALADARELRKIITESPLQTTVDTELRETIHSVEFVREFLGLVKLGFYANSKMTRELVEKGTRATDLLEKRQQTTRPEFRSYLRRLGITRPQGQLERSFNLA